MGPPFSRLFFPLQRLGQGRLFSLAAPPQKKNSSVRFDRHTTIALRAQQNLPTYSLTHFAAPTAVGPFFPPSPPFGLFLPA